MQKRKRFTITTSAVVALILVGAVAGVSPANALTNDELNGFNTYPVAEPSQWYALHPTSNAGLTLGNQTRVNMSQTIVSSARYGDGDGGAVSGYQRDLSDLYIKAAVTVTASPTPGAAAQAYQAYSIVSYNMGIFMGELEFDDIRVAKDPYCLEVPGNNPAYGASVELYKCNPNYENQENQLWIPILKTVNGQVAWQFINVAELQASGNIISSAAWLAVQNSGASGSAEDGAKVVLGGPYQPGTLNPAANDGGTTWFVEDRGIGWSTGPLVNPAPFVGITIF